MVNVLQLENVNAQDFKNEILSEIKNIFSGFANTLQTNDSDKLLTREETAKMLSISLVTLWDWTNKNILQAYRIGKKVRYKKSEVLEALQKRNNFSS
jgi:excisionase family DNA binding protein